MPIGERAPKHGGPFWGRPAELVEIAAELTGLSEDAVIDALREGQSFAEIAEAEGVDPQEIVEAATAEAESRLEEAVENDRLTEEQMDQTLDRLAQELPERLEQAWEPSGPTGHILGPFGQAFWTAYDAVAEALGLEPQAFFTKLHDGRTVAEIAEEQGVQMDEVRDALDSAQVEARKQAIEQAVDDGRLTQEQADWMIEGLEQGYVPHGRFGSHRRGLGFGKNSGPGGGFMPGHGGRGRGRGW
jgi:hypothetical protein